RLREADLLDPHLLAEEVDDLLALRGSLDPLDPGVDVFRVLAEDHHVDLLRVLDWRRHALEVAHGPEAYVEVEHLSKRHIERAEPLADGRGERPLDRDQVLANDIDRLLWEQVGR